MFTEKAQRVVDLAKDHAFSAGSKELTAQALLSAVCCRSEAAGMLAECVGQPVDEVRKACCAPDDIVSCPNKMPLSCAVQSILTTAKEYAREVPDSSRPGMIDLRHLICAAVTTHDACTVLHVDPMTRDNALRQLSTWYERDASTPRLDDLTESLQEMRSGLLAKVFGQDHAVHAFVEGIFNAEVVSAADTERRAPRAVFVFAGPPGVGKTYLAELGASFLKRAFKRFDMSAFSGHQQNEALVGMARSFHGAHPGILTEFVEKNPNAVLLFDEIEKAHIKTIQLFLQVLDSGTLEDKYNERNVEFRDTTIIFTTNAGARLYERSNESGIHASNSTFHRKTILDALASETDPQTRQPIFPASICSRLATGYPVLFNHLQVNELERVVKAELDRVGGLLERQYYKRITFDDWVPMSLVLREGAHADARSLRSQADGFVKSEFYKFCRLYKTDRLEEALQQVDGVHFTVEEGAMTLDGIRQLFDCRDRPHILLVADDDLADLYSEFVPEVSWSAASAPEDALEVLANQEVDMVLLDLWIGHSLETSSLDMTMQHFDHVPAAARGINRGQELLRQIHKRVPTAPVFLLSLSHSGEGADDHASVDEELLAACVQGGGARGVITSRFIDGMVKGWNKDRDDFANELEQTGRRLHRQRAAEKLGRERKVLTFETAPNIDDKAKTVTIRLRNLSLVRAIAALDAGEIIEDVERPTATFGDVIGADGAKDELGFFIDYLKNPKRFAALGLKPPKGVLLHGPPGTGKTMLARAMAGESDVAFIQVAASSFVTVWQGSGPQNVRDLFARARRYAPAIVFIDEIDAIGRTRTGGGGGAQAVENTLNALLTEMDGFVSPSPDRPVFVLAATNVSIESEDQSATHRPTLTLDPALVRRFSRCVLVDLPDAAARRQYLLRRFSGRGNENITESGIELLTEKTTGMTIAGLEQVIEAAGRAALKHGTQITEVLLSDAVDTLREGEEKEWSPEFLENTARHEAGHTIMYWLSGWISPEVSIIARADRGGGMRRSEEEMKRESLSREEMLARIRVALGGRAAELLYYGPEAGLTTGAAGDLESATQIARQMICRYGMDEEFGLLSTPELFKYAEAISSPIYERVNQTVGRILKTEMEHTRKLLEQHHESLDVVARALLEKNRLYRKELETILLPAGKTTTQEELHYTESVEELSHTDE